MTTFLKINKISSDQNESPQNAQQENDQKSLNNILETLNSVRKYQAEYLELGVDRVNEYVESVEGEWLENW